MTIVSITALLLAGRQMGNRSHAAGARSRSVSVLRGDPDGDERFSRRQSAAREDANHRTPPSVGPGLPALLTVSSIAAAVYGLTHRELSLHRLLGDRHAWRRRQSRLLADAPSHPMHWWFEHMSSMLGACIAATTAFLVVNAEQPWTGDVLAGRVAGADAHRRADNRDLDSLLPAQVCAGRTSCCGDAGNLRERRQR